MLTMLADSEAENLGTSVFIHQGKLFCAATNRVALQGHASSTNSVTNEK